MNQHFNSRSGEGISLKSIDQIIDHVANAITTEGDAAKAGIEEEALLSDRDGCLIPRGPEYDTLLERLITRPSKDDHPQLNFDDSLDNNNQKILLGGDLLPFGRYDPETNTAVLEFVHEPQKSAWQTFDISSWLNAHQRTAMWFTPFLTLGVAMLPNVDFETFKDSRYITPCKDFAYSVNNMRQGLRKNVCKTSFGTTSTHNNQGFSDPELLARYARVCLYIQPTMIALTANSPLYDGKPATDEKGKKLLSLRSYLQLGYETLFGKNDMSYLYPDHMLNFSHSFGDVVQGFIEQPLDRTIVNGQKTYVGSMTMKDYLGSGYVGNEGGACYPSVQAIDMMFSEPMTDVRIRPLKGPRVETRAHDGGPFFVGPSINAFYRGILENIEEAERFLQETYTVESIRQQRRLVCNYGLRTPVNTSQRKEETQQEIALRLLRISEDGLKARALEEERLLEPLFDIAKSNITLAERQIELYKEYVSSGSERAMAGFLERVKRDQFGLFDHNQFKFFDTAHQRTDLNLLKSSLPGLIRCFKYDYGMKRPKNAMPC